MKKYTTILFDADETLLDFGKDETQALTAILEKYGIEKSDENINAYKEINNGLWKAIEKGEIDKPTLKQIRFRLFFEKIGFATDDDCFRINEEYLANLSGGGNLKAGARQLLDELKKQGYDLYIVTNGIADTQRKRLTKAGILPFFSDIFVSEAVGHQKPKKEYFDYVLSHIREKDIGKVLLVGDSQSSDIKGATQAGIPCVWLRNNSSEISLYSPDYIIDSISQLRDLL